MRRFGGLKRAAMVHHGAIGLFAASHLTAGHLAGFLASLRYGRAGGRKKREREQGAERQAADLGAHTANYSKLQAGDNLGRRSEPRVSATNEAWFC